MTPPVDPITESDLHGYIDDQLSVQRRIAVEAHLSRHPEMAAQVMSDLRGRDELRLSLADQMIVERPATQEAARRLSNALSRDVLLGRLRRIAAVDQLSLRWAGSRMVRSVLSGSARAWRRRRRRPSSKMRHGLTAPRW